MRELVNRIVWHKSFGEGIIEKQETAGKNNYVWIRFKCTDPEKDLMKFQYPDAFGSYLCLDENDLQKEILEEIESKKKALAEQKKRESEERRGRRPANLPLNKKKDVRREIRTRGSNLRYRDWESLYPDYVIVQKEGFMYTSHNESAEALNDALDYELFTDSYDRLTTGGPDMAKIGFALEDNNYKYIIVEGGQIIDRFDGR